MRASRQEYEKLRKKLVDDLMLARSLVANTNNNTKIRDDASKLAEKLEADIQAIDDILSGKRTEKSYWDTKPDTFSSLGSMLRRRFTKHKK
jgi:adenine-specific DNA methylase